ncbi:MAG: hypothetical protein AABX32_02325, partial [Nanoarchaeota archaeon]
YDLDSEEKEITKAKLNPDGRLGTLEKSSLEEMEKALVDFKSPGKSSIKESIFEDLKKVFGKDVEILMSY